MTHNREAGSVTVFVTIMTAALVVVAGLVVDGAQILNARREATNIAESAARAGAQQLNEAAARRDGSAVLDPRSAIERAEAFLAASGHEGTAQADESAVTVTVSMTQPLLILGVGGMAEVDITGTGIATPLRGITEAGQ